ncbi:MAG: PAS domain S-box protein [Acidimicrobiales bacterium]
MISENADGMLVVDPGGVVRFANPAAEHLLSGLTRSLEGTQLAYPLVPGESTEIDIVADESPRTAEMRVVGIEWEGEPALLASLRDVTDRKRAEARFRGLLESAPYAIVIIDKRRRVLLANAQAEELFGYTRSELLELTIDALVPERFRELHAGQMTRYSDSPRPRPLRSGLELYALRKDGSEIPVEISLGPIETEEGTLVSATIEDITEVKRAEIALREAEERFRRAFEEAPIGMAMLDPDGRFVQVNDALCDITGYSRDQLEATSLDAITHPDDLGAEEQSIGSVLADEAASYRSEKRLVDAAQRPVLVAMQATLLRDSEGNSLNILAQIQDITDRRRDEDRLRHLADHDALTGLLNRRSFEHEVAAHRARSVRYGGGGAAIMLDLDHFKFINDTLGHRAGDETVARAANVLRSRLRETDVLARLGGDEFAVLLPRADAPRALLVAEELLEALRGETVQLGSHQRSLAASAGVALFESEDDPHGEDVLVKADLAMYEAKKAGRDRVELYAAGEHGSSGTRRHVT